MSDVDPIDAALRGAPWAVQLVVAVALLTLAVWMLRRLR